MRTRTKGIQLNGAERIVNKQYKGQRIFQRLGAVSQSEAESWLRQRQADIDAEAKARNVPTWSIAEAVLMLLKSLYGLVQSSHLFWQKQSATMTKKLKLDRSKVDYCLYFKWFGDKLFLSVNWILV